MQVFLYAISAIVMARIVKSYAKLPEVPNFLLDFAIQLLHITAFGFLLVALITIDTVTLFSIIIALYCLIYLVLCIKEFILDVIDVITNTDDYLND